MQDESLLRWGVLAAALVGGIVLIAAAFASGDDLSGLPASPGLAVGRARIVVDPPDLAAALQALAPGEVLVTRATDPAWTPIFPRIAGLVMEVGGQLSHGSVVAREYGIPAVVGVRAATGRLRDGDLIRVDGNNGIVTRLRGERSWQTDGE